MRAAPAILFLAIATCGTPPPELPRRTAPSSTPSDAIPSTASTAGTKKAPAEVPPAYPPPPTVHVVLSRSAAAGRAKVTLKGAWALVSVQGAVLRTGAALDAELLLVASGSTLGGATFPFDAELRPVTDGDLRIDGRVYSGTLRVELWPDGKARPMISTDVETYVAQVVNAEIPAAFSREAQRAQAIVARTYALASTLRTSREAPLVLTDVGGTDQEFTGIAAVAEHRRVSLDAAQSTRGLVLCDQGAPFVAYYHSTCGGTTCPGAVVFGKSGSSRPLAGGVDCLWCTSSKYFRWEARIAGAGVAKATGIEGGLQSFVVAERTAGGRATWFDATVGGRTKRISAPEFRLKVGASALRSVLLDGASVDAGDLVVRGRGWGHGVGLCQMGAKTLAERGRTAESILSLYYPGAALERRW